MLKPYWSFIPALDGTVTPSINLSRNLDKIGQHFDWQRFEKHLLALNVWHRNTIAHHPLVIFRALLIQQWFALIAVEYESCLSDSLACRKFVGLRDGEPAPSYEAVAALRRLLKMRGAVGYFFEEFQRQVETLGLRLADPEGRALPKGDATLEIDTPRVLQLNASDRWTEMNDRLMALWNRRRGNRALPTLKDIKLSDIADIEPCAILLRNDKTLGDFRYEFAGEDVVRGNGSSPVGTSIHQKKARNLRIFGHPGLQRELQRTFGKSAGVGAPNDTSTFFMNLKYRKSEMTVSVAPLLGNDQTVDMLIGVALIEPVKII